MENSSKCKKKQHDLAHSSSEVKAKLNFTVFIEVKALSRANAITEKRKGNGCSRRGIKGARQSSNREKCCCNNSNMVLF